jgi:hypothetical protein
VQKAANYSGLAGRMLFFVVLQDYEGGNLS